MFLNVSPGKLGLPGKDENVRSLPYNCNLYEQTFGTSVQKKAHVNNHSSNSDESKDKEDDKVLLTMSAETLTLALDTDVVQELF